MLVITRRQGEAVVIGKDIEIIVSEVSGDKIKLCIDAPREISIMRKELLETGNMNKEAVETVDSSGLEQFKNMAKVMKNL
ncbi:MAG: carbon storage regulator [Oscillospiraceae bacterium]|nr:carbon storage regulator [Oscillospiraceae bacterium]